MILAVPSGTLSGTQKGQLAKKGYIVIECDDPQKIRVITPEQSMDTNDWFMAALKSLTKASPLNETDYFVNELYRRLKKREEPPVETNNS